MRKERKQLPLDSIELNTGQLPWLPKNPRTWTQTDIDRTATSIREDTDFLEDRPLLVTPCGEKFVAFAGNLRHEGAAAAKLASVPAVVYFPDTDEDFATVKRRAMKDNGSFGSWDWDELANSWDDLPLTDWGVPAWPEEEQQAAATETHEDDFDEEKDEIHVRCQKGDIWQLGEHRLMCGDSIDLEQVKALMGGAKADIAFASPPYNTGGLGKNITKDNGRSKYIDNDDDKSIDDYTEFVDTYIRNANEMSEYNFVNIQMLANNKQSFIDILANNRDKLADIIIWDKGRSQPAAAVNVLNSTFEFVLVFSKKATRAIGTIPFHGTLHNIIHIDPARNEYAEIHNAVFPVALPSHFIEHFAKERVLDLFGGTGTTLIAAEQLGRKCYTMEIDPHYCDVIIARWEKETGKTAVKLN